MAVRLATGPVCWGVDFADAPANPPWCLVLDEIEHSGIRSIELGPLGYLPEDPGVLRSELGRRGLGVAASFVFEPLHDPARLRDIVLTTRRTCQLIAGTGGRHLVVIDLVDRERVATAGRSDDARRLDADAWDVLMEAVATVSEVAREEFGLRPVLHPHVGTFIEFEDEIERALTALDPSLVELCVDTGHCAYAGVDPVALYRRHAGRVSHLHLKDLDPGVLNQALAERLDFWTAIDRGVFCPLGSGCVDFAALGAALRAKGFDGWATVEQDRDAGRPGGALADVVASREFLERIGLADEAATKASTA
jgi:inosose dehydratase